MQHKKKKQKKKKKKEKKKKSKAECKEIPLDLGKCNGHDHYAIDFILLTFEI